MGVIDEKGRLFGKINIIDFLVLVLIFALLPMFYLGYKAFVKRSAQAVVAPGDFFIEREIECRFIKLEPEVAKIISVGDQALDGRGQVIGKIVSLTEAVPYKYEFSIDGGKTLSHQDDILKQIDARLKLEFGVENGKLYYQNQKIKIDSPFEFKTDKYSVMALPYEKLEEIALQEKMLNLDVILKDLDEDTLAKISVGDKVIGKNGAVIAEILSLGRIEDSSVDLNLGEGNFVMAKDSNKKQLSVVMRLKCQIKDIEEGRQLYLQDKRITHNTFFEFKTEKYKVKARLSRTFELTSPLQEKWIPLQVKFTGLLPEIANAVRKGDIEQSVFGKTIARISSIISNKPSEMFVLQKDIVIDALRHPFNRDLLVNLDVQCIEKENVYYFKNYPVKMGNRIVFSTDLYSITGLIVGMELK